MTNGNNRRIPNTAMRIPTVKNIWRQNGLVRFRIWVTAGIGPVRAVEFPDGSPSYEKLIVAAHPQIAAFGGMFLLMLFLDFVFHDWDIKWLKWIEVPFARVGRLGQVSVTVAGATRVLVGSRLTHSADERATVLTAGVLGLVTYLAVNGGSMFVRSITIYLVKQTPWTGTCTWNTPRIGRSARWP